MLTNEVLDLNLAEIRDSLRQHIPEEAQEYYIASNSETNIHYPVKQYPQKVKTLNLDKTPEFEGVLKGIKGQYFLFEDQTVFNVRSNEGYVVEIVLR